MTSKGKKSKTENKSKEKKEEVLRPSEKELILQAELDKKVEELTEAKLRVRKAQEENNWLEEEATKVRSETAEYVQYMSKKTNLRQAQIVTLTDYHRQEIEEINQDKENMLKEYEKKKEELRSQLMKKEQLLSQTKRELETMEEYKNIQTQQNSEIKRLQDEVNQIRGEHVREIAQMRLTFERELQRQRSDEDSKVQEIRRQADKEAEQFLYDRTISIQDENYRLRKTLHDLLKRISAVNQAKEQLNIEQIQLIRQLRLATDLKRIRLDKIQTTIQNNSSQ